MSKCKTCGHQKPDGAICQSPALRGERFCYYHLEARRRSQRMARNARRCEQRSLPPADPSQPLQTVTLSIVSNEINPRKARLVLFALQNFPSMSGSEIQE